MKRTFYRPGGLAAALAAAVGCIASAAAQEPLHEVLHLSVPDSLTAFYRRDADALSLVPHAVADTAAPPVVWQLPVVAPLSPSVRHGRGGLPEHMHVINNIVLQIGGYVNLTNGQAWIWSPYPNGYLDARTLSLPMPR